MDADDVPAYTVIVGGTASTFESFDVNMTSCELATTTSMLAVSCDAAPTEGVPAMLTYSSCALLSTVSPSVFDEPLTVNVRFVAPADIAVSWICTKLDPAGIVVVAGTLTTDGSVPEIVSAVALATCALSEMLT